MVFVKLLGMVDIVAAVMLLLVSSHIISSWRVVAVVAGALIIKGVLFIKNVVSMIDIAIGVYFFIALFHPVMVLSVVFCAHLTIKGLFSFFS